MPGVWELITEDYLKAKVHQILKERGIQGYGSNSYINNIIGAMKRELYLRKWRQRSSCELLPFKNGVLELATGKFYDHSPDFRLTWQLPRNYDILSLDWSGIDRWLDEATQGNEKDKHLLLCFAAAVLRGALLNNVFSYQTLSYLTISVIIVIVKEVRDEVCQSAKSISNARGFN